jgi:anaerobic selenocysteine-containing dehydrogenase
MNSESRNEKTSETTRTVYRACHLCEAICGLEIKIEGDTITSIRGDDADPFSRGHICPKAVAIKDIHEDPDRLRLPMKRVGIEWTAISWDEAFDFAAEKIAGIQQAHGNNAVGFYAGNPSVHNVGTLFSVPALARTLKTKSAFSATSVDQLPQQLTSLLMFGHQFMIPIPDIDRTDYFLILGGNPVASNGSMMTVPDVTKRLQAIVKRGGKVIVIDPRRTETADIASEHHFIKPGTDAVLLMAILNTLKSESLFRITPAQSAKHNDLDLALAAIAEFTPETAAGITGIDAAAIRRIAREFAHANSAVCYGRLGTTLQSFGTVNQWLIQLINLVTGSLDRVGGTMPTTPIIPITGAGTKPGHYNQWQSRVGKLPESGGELPSAAMAEEILTMGDGQVRGMVTICGNPVLSTPDGRKLDEALASLEFMLAIDIYINETTRHAHLILPPTSSLNHDHYDFIFNAFAVRNVARYNQAVWPRPPQERYDWEIFGELCKRISAKTGRPPVGTASTATMIEGMLAKSPAARGVTFASLNASEHGLDLGPLTPSLYSRLETPDGKIQCAPAPIIADVARVNSTFLSKATVPNSSPDKEFQASLQLIGRRHVRSNNSWMHNYHRLVKGKPRDQLMMNPADAAARGLADGQLVEVTSAIGAIRIVLKATDEVMPGVVCLPHGWGHARDGTRLTLAQQHAGASYNDLSDASRIDAISGNAAMNGTPVQVRQVA